MLESIETKNAPEPIGPYSQAIRSGSFVWVSGCIALHPETGIMQQDSLEAETHQVLKNLAAILEKSGSSLSKIVKTTIFLTDLSRFADVNQIYGSYLSKPYPARETVQVSALPKGANVEISCMAIV